MSCRTFAGCVHAMSVSIRNVAREGTLCIVPALIVQSTVARWQGGGNLVRGGPVIPNEALSVGTFSASRLWYGDGSLHDGFKVLTHILSVWSASRVVLGAFVRSTHPTLEFHFGSSHFAQGTCWSRAVCRLLFVVVFFQSRFLTMGRRGWAPAPEGWVQIIRGPRPPAMRWSKADAWPVVGRNPSDRSWLRPDRTTKSLDIVVEEAKKGGGDRGSTRSFVGSRSDRRPGGAVLEGISAEGEASDPRTTTRHSFVDGARTRPEKLVNELEASQSRLVRLRALAEATPKLQPPREVDSEIAALAMEEERDVRGRRPKRLAMAEEDAGSVPGQELPPMPSCRVPFELDRWMHHCHQEFHEGMEFGDNTKVLELSSKLSDAAVKMSEFTGHMEP